MTLAKLLPPSLCVYFSFLTRERLPFFVTVHGSDEGNKNAKCKIGNAKCKTGGAFSAPKIFCILHSLFCIPAYSLPLRLHLVNGYPFIEPACFGRSLNLPLCPNGRSRLLPRQSGFAELRFLFQYTRDRVTDREERPEERPDDATPVASGESGWGRSNW